MTETIIEKPCQGCGCEIFPLTTDYSPARIKCDKCIKKGYAERQAKVRVARRKILNELGLTVSLDNCLYCNKPLPSHKPKFCGKVCNKSMMRIRTVTANLENMKMRKRKLRNEELRTKRLLTKLQDLREKI
jgi:recombinational DNA repair protein (RecF pathway)